MQAISWIAEKLLASTKELRSMDVIDVLVGLLSGRLFIYFLGQLLS
jgi:hypothetical protein